MKESCTWRPRISPSALWEPLSLTEQLTGLVSPAPKHASETHQVWSFANETIWDVLQTTSWCLCIMLLELLQTLHPLLTLEHADRYASWIKRNHAVLAFEQLWLASNPILIFLLEEDLVGASAPENVSVTMPGIYPPSHYRIVGLMKKSSTITFRQSSMFMKGSFMQSKRCCLIFFCSWWWQDMASVW